MTALVMWGGPRHGTTITVPDPPPNPLLIATGDTGALAGVYTYRLERVADRRPSQLARDRREPPWWHVYVLETATRAQLDAWLRRSSRPMVAGPRLDAPPPYVARVRERLRAPEHDIVPIGADLPPAPRPVRTPVRFLP